jgi:hypothetical protein
MFIAFVIYEKYDFSLILLFIYFLILTCICLKHVKCYLLLIFFFK